VTVFVDGDYWHARILRENGLDALVQRIRSPNRDYWLRKFERRVQLDDRVTSELQDAGWIVIRLWESDVIAQLPESADLIEEIVRQRQTLAG
jgi:DNA mismatch endonuclease (patch repair protein)